MYPYANDSLVSGQHMNSEADLLCYRLREDRNKHRNQQALMMGSSGGLHHVSMGLRPIPNTSLYVSPIALGTMTFGTPVGQQEAAGKCVH